MQFILFSCFSSQPPKQYCHQNKCVLKCCIDFSAESPVKFSKCKAFYRFYSKLYWFLFLIPESTPLVVVDYLLNVLWIQLKYARLCWSITPVDNHREHWFWWVFICFISSSLASSGGWEGEANFKMSFLNGGAIEVGQHLFKLATNGLCLVPSLLSTALSIFKDKIPRLKYNLFKRRQHSVRPCDPGCVSFQSAFKRPLISIVLASRAAPAQNGAFSYGYPSPSMMNSYGPPPAAPPSYAYPPPGQQNGFYQGPPPPAAAAGNMGYHYPTAPTGRPRHFCCWDIDRSAWFSVSGDIFFCWLTFYRHSNLFYNTIFPPWVLLCSRNVPPWGWLHGPTSSISRATSKLGRTTPELDTNSTTFRFAPPISLFLSSCLRHCTRQMRSASFFLLSWITLNHVLTPQKKAASPMSHPMHVKTTKVKTPPLCLCPLFSHLAD